MEEKHDEDDKDDGQGRGRRTRTTRTHRVVDPDVREGVHAARAAVEDERVRERRVGVVRVGDRAREDGGVVVAPGAKHTLAHNDRLPRNHVQQQQQQHTQKN